jgi:solute carrier family 50 (sugar transporter)
MLSCYGLANTKTKDRQLAILLFFTFVLSLVAAIGVMTRMSSLKQLWGFTANAILLVYYAAPLSTIFTVISTRSAATLNVPLAVMQLINGSTWCAYGLAKADP